MKALGSFLGTITALVLLFGPIVTHIVWCIGKAAETGSAIALLIVGLILAPVAWLHGVAIWLGFTWI